MDREVVFEGLSALLGVSVTPLSKSVTSNLEDVPLLSVEKLLPAAWFELNVLFDPVSAVAGLVKKLAVADSPAASEEGRGESANSAIRKELLIDENEFFDPRYDYDFTNERDTSVCQRGNEPYKRPFGWNRVALKVRGKYKDRNAWLGPDGWRSHSAPGEWPVAFHGTTIEGAKGIIQSGYKAGPRAEYGRGIYSTPNIDVAVGHGYAKNFTSKKTGKTYTIVLQNRVNPKVRQICTKQEYWLVPVPEGTSAERERKIVDSGIRPYGLLLKEV